MTTDEHVATATALGQDMPRADSGWLALREPADAAARARRLVEVLRGHLADTPRLVIHDLGCGTGSMGRWLAPQLHGRQHWIMHDRDPDLLRLAEAHTDVGDLPVTAETRAGDIDDLTAADLTDTALVTASALLDLLTVDEIDRLADTVIAAGCPALLTLSVVGRVELTPADPLDATISEGFNAHQRRTIADRTLLGPDAVGAANEAFTRRGAQVTVHPSPWRLGRTDTELITHWLRGWTDAAVEYQPELAEHAQAYTARRLAQQAQGLLEVTVHHDDLLACPVTTAHGD